MTTTTNKRSETGTNEEKASAIRRTATLQVAPTR